MKEVPLTCLGAKTVINNFYCDVFKGLSGIHPTDVVYPYYLNKPYVASSFNNFISRELANGSINNLITREIKPDSKLKPNKFTVMTYCGRDGRSLKTPIRAFYFDGDYSLMLFYGNTNDMVGVGVSFALAKDRYIGSSYNLSPYFVDTLSPIIMQIQGSDRAMGLNAVQNTFTEFRWERLLVGIVSLWAKSAGFPQIMLLPHEKSMWNKVSENVHGTAALRYDITAQRMGFKRPCKEAPYILEIEDGEKELYKQLFAK